PEILSMTLQLEWTVVDLKPTRDLLEFFGLDSHYYIIHIGIDNAVNGHGQRSRRGGASLSGAGARRWRWRRSGAAPMAANLERLYRFWQSRELFFRSRRPDNQ